MNVSPDLRYPAVTPEFRDAIEELNNPGLKTSHARDITTSAININEVVRLAQENQISLPNCQEIRRNIPLKQIQPLPKKHRRQLRHRWQVNEMLHLQSPRGWDG